MPNEGIPPVLQEEIPIVQAGAPVIDAYSDAWRNFFPSNFFQIGRDEIWDDFPIGEGARRYKKRLPKAPITRKEENALRRVLTGADGQEVIDPITLKMTRKSERRMIKAFKEVVRNGGDIRAALEAVGYAKLYINEPGRVTRSKTWQEISDYYFPPHLLAKKNEELLNHKDWHAVNAVLERLHKLRGDFVRKVKIEITQPDQYRELKDEDLRNIIEGEIIQQVEDLDVIPKDGD